MKKDFKSQFPMPTEANTGGEMGVRTELDPKNPSSTVDRYAGDSVDQHKELERANEHFADEEISQIIDNS
ncbi:hypothetical protein ACFFHM_13505 [Halalkalibacter kiskunsagensis]|uniref:Uncharacterized protein n=1 Tax=Halalkalibacter kiskunsagensis TaxID=1548599 RepID=A0ABV6KE08_9BACI